MKKYSCLMFFSLSPDREVTATYKEIEAMSLQEAAVHYCKDFYSGPNVYFLVVSDGKDYSKVYEIIIKVNYQGKQSMSIKALKDLSKDVMDVLVSHTLSRRE